MSNKIKSGLVAAFFLQHLLLASALATPLFEEISPQVADQLNEAAKAGKIYKSPVWSALLHANNGQPNIADANFLLSLPDFSLEKELQQTIDFLYRGEQINVCRFPARYLWLRKQLNAPELPLDECKDIVEFRQRAPLDEIYLVFASESITQPASMLGHAFLKFSGKNEQGQQVSHAISFYTDADTINLPKLLFDSLIIGKKGYFSLSPYNEKQQLYVDDEQRNLWEYQLALDSFQKELIRLHLHELKQSQLTYFFHRYNCATLLDFILKLSGKSIPDTDWWVTPKDLIKHAQQAGLIADTRVITPSHWLVRTLADQVPAIEQQSIQKQVQLGTVADGLDRSGSESAFIRLELARAYNQHAYLKDNLDKRLWLVNDRDLAVIKRESFPDKSLNTDNRYNPINTPGDSQIALAIQHDKDGDALSVTVIPVSHTLNDDNRNYASETSLQLLAPTIKIPLNNGRPKLDRLTIYDMQSLLPYKNMTGGVSGRFRIAVEPQLNSQLVVGRVFSVSGALGLTKRIGSDFDIYSLGGAGAAYTGSQGFFYTTVEAGAILRELWDMKSLLSITRTDNQIDTGSHYYTLRISQSKFLDKTHTLNLDWKRDFNDNDGNNTIGITLKKVF